MILLLISSENGPTGNFHINLLNAINILFQCYNAVQQNVQKEGKSFLQANRTYIKRPCYSFGRHRKSSVCLLQQQ